MRAAATELADPAALVLAVATLAAARLVQPAWWLAIAAAGAVLVVKAGSGAVLAGRASAQPTTAAHGLSRREVEIARHVTHGLTNKEIAARLFIAERTVDNHVQHILTKLDFRSRAQIARWAVEHGLISEADK